MKVDKQVEYYQRILQEGNIPDDQNPITIVQTFPQELLLKIALGQLDIKSFAIHELKCRGLGSKGEWIGFDQAEAFWEKTKQVNTSSSKHLRMFL